MKLDNRAKARKISFVLLHAVFLIGILESMALMLDPMGFAAQSGIPALAAAKLKDVKAIIIVWVLFSVVSVVFSRKKIFVFDSEGDAYRWDQPLWYTGIVWFFSALIPQLAMAVYLDLYLYLMQFGNLIGLVCFAAKLVCTGYAAFVLFRDRT